MPPSIVIPDGTNHWHFPDSWTEEQIKAWLEKAKPAAPPTKDTA